MEQRRHKNVKTLSVGEQGNIKLEGHGVSNKCIHTKDNRTQLKQYPLGNVRQTEQVYKGVPKAITNTLRSINNTVDYFSNIVQTKMGNTVQSQMSYISRNENSYDGVNKLNAGSNRGHQSEIEAPDTTQRETIQQREKLNVASATGHTQKPLDSFRHNQRIEIATNAAKQERGVGFRADTDSHTTRFEDKAKISGREYMAQEAQKTSTSGSTLNSLHFEDKANATGRETLEDFENSNVGSEVPCLKLGLMDELNPTGRETLDGEDTAGNIAPISEIYVAQSDGVRGTQKEELVDQNVISHPGSQISNNQNYGSAYNATVNNAKEESVIGRQPGGGGSKVAGAIDEICLLYTSDAADE